MGVMEQVSHCMSSQFRGVKNARPSSQLWVGTLAKCPQNIGLGKSSYKMERTIFQNRKLPNRGRFRVCCCFNLSDTLFPTARTLPSCGGWREFRIRRFIYLPFIISLLSVRQCHLRTVCVKRNKYSRSLCKDVDLEYCS